MTERPILFSAPMIRALLDGRKTQTRRVVKTPAYYACLTGDCPHQLQADCDADLAARSPYGVPGDLLWVRETWAAQEAFDHLSPTAIGDLWTEEHGEPSCPIRYAADGKCNDWSAEQWQESPVGKTRVSIHMPRWASRISLRITDVRVERLQGISTSDCYAEGCYRPVGPILGSEVTRRDNARGEYRRIWNTINGPGSWDENPWVWAVSFKRAQP